MYNDRINSEYGELWRGDCMEILPMLPAGSVDMVLCDLPYGVTHRQSKSARWDCVLDLDALFREYVRIVKPNGAIVLFSSGMFTAQLMMCRPEIWRYNLVWCKGNRVSGFLNANRQPMRNHEDICVFYRKLPVYNPQFTKDGKLHQRGGNNGRNNINGEYKRSGPGYTTDKIYPRSVLNFSKPAINNHPSEKPVDLLRYLIRMYTNEGDCVLDNTMGSGSTCVAAVQTKRKYIGIEKDAAFFDVATGRVKWAENNEKNDFFK